MSVRRIVGVEEMALIVQLDTQVYMSHFVVLTPQGNKRSST
jgi:hypothetical protein